MSGFKSTLVAAVAAVVLSSGIALAQAPAAAPPAAAPAPVAVPSAAPKADTSAPVAGVKKAAVAPKKGVPNAADRTPESLACSAELDAKGIHGKAGGRPAAMRKCVAAAKKAKASGAAPAKKN